MADFLIELSIALHKHAMYPEGHPSLAPAAERVAQRLDPLLVERGTLSLGVAHNQLVIEGVATDPQNPVLRDLADRLHRHHLGAVSFRRGSDPFEIQDLLAVIAVEADRTGKPIGLGPREQLITWPHISLHPLTYESLELLDDEESEAAEEDRSSRTRAAELWVGLARAAMASEDADPDAIEASNTEPAVVAKAIDEHEGGTAYDQVIVGYLLKIAEELRGAKGGEAAALKKRMSKLVGTLDRGTLERLLEMGGDRTQRRQFLLNASEGMAVDAVVELVRAASESHEQTISHSMLRMLQKLSQHAEVSRGDRRAVAEISVREQVSELINGWTLNDPNPGAYGEALQKMAGSAPVFSVAPDMRYRPEPMRIVQMAFELDTAGEAVTRAVDALAEKGSVRWLLDLVDDEQSPVASAAIVEQLGGRERFESLLQADPIDAAALDLLLQHIGVNAAEPMLEVLVESDSQQTRRTILDRLVKLGPDIFPFLMTHLDDPRWFVQRNMLSIIGEMQDLPPEFDGAKFMQHSDPRVRREAVRILLRNPKSRERAICAALTDSDSRTVRAGLAAAAESCPGAAVPLLAKMATSDDAGELRVAAVRVLAASGIREAAAPLIRMAEPRKTLLGWKLPPKSRVFLEALTGLRRFQSDPRAKKTLLIAAKSRDPDVRNAALGEAGES
ncbi:MAG: HEAT repeat domain-containing protein [Gemmatimonadales bacterium]